MLQTALLGLAGIAIGALVASYFSVLLGDLLSRGFEVDRSTAIMLALVGLLSVPGFFFGADTQVRSATAESVRGSLVIQGLLIVAIGAVVLPRVSANLLLRPAKPLGARAFRFYSLFTLLAVLSTAYSPKPAYTLAKALYTLAFFGVLLHFAITVQECRPESRASYVRRIWTTLIWSMAAFLSLVWISAILSPGTAFSGLAGENRLYGSWFHWSPNLLGQLGAVLAVVFLARLDRQGIGVRNTAGFILGTATLFAAWSRASIFAAIAAVGILAVIRRKRLFIFSAVGFGILGILAASDLLMEYLLRGQSVTEFQHATGRLISWGFSVSVAMESPLLGHGYYVGPGLVADRFNLRLSNLDNTFLEVWVDLGLVGVLAIVAFFTATVLPFVRRSVDRVRGFHDEMAAVLLIIGLRAVSGPTFHEPDFNLMLMVIIGLAGWLKTQQTVRGNADGRESKGRYSPLVPNDAIAGKDSRGEP